ncbi:MAG: capsid protein [Ljubljana dicistrovirus 1]|nr:MAG: capsid protein [Ljubljana dicistrovirus 1]
MSKNENQGSESGPADVAHTMSSITFGDFGGSDNLDEWENGPSHTSSQGSEGGTLLGPSESKKFNDSTGFISEGKVETKRMDEPKEDLTLLSALHPTVEQRHSIETIMSRPVNIGTITFTAQSSPGQILGSYDVIDTIRTNSRFRLLREKLSSFYGVHMNAHLKVTFNAQPMESGLFQIFFIPFFRTEGSVVDPLQFTSNYESMLPYTTGCPNIPCNISKQSEQELAIPYTGPVAFINLTNIQADFGRFFVQSIVPISDSTNNASCELSVYMYFTNIKLFGTTANNVIAVPQGLSDIKPSECDEDAMKKGPLSSIGSNVSNLASSVAGKNNPVTQIGNTLLPILDSLGLSAPDANPNVDRMVINPFSSPATIDTTASPMKVSYMFKHHLDIGHLGVNNKVDEMDLKTIAAKPCYYNQFTWNTSNQAETRLFSYSVEPNCLIKNDTNVPAPTRFRFVANNFRYWRGTVKFLFMVAANQFHSGRLRLVYTLGGTLPGEFADNYPRTFSQVIDIRKGAHFVVECPYFASTPWRLVPQRWNDTTNRYFDSDAGSLDDVPAMLEIFVENELRATSTTSSSIQIVCFQGCGSDFEFACPLAPRSRPYINAAVPDGVELVAEPQGLDFQPINMASGLSRSQPHASKPHKFTVGEDISSVRQLIKRYQFLGTGQVNNPDSTFVIYPFAMIRPEGVPTLSYDHLAVFSTLYQFRRGSIRYMLVPDIAARFTLRYDPELGVQDTPVIDPAIPFGDLVPIRNVISFPSGVGILEQNLTATIPFDTNLQGSIEVEFPYYSRFHKLKTAVFNRDSINGQYSGMIREGRVPAGLAFFRADTENAYFLNVYRSAADDFTLGYLLGAPLTMYRDRL